MRTYNKREFIQSIVNELNRLFNTRCIIPKDELKNRERTVIDYGVSDFTLMNPRALEDHYHLEKAFKDAIAKFEPRMQDLKVKVQQVLKNEKSLVVQVEGVVYTSSVREPVSFPIAVRRETGQVEVNAQ